MKQEFNTHYMKLTVLLLSMMLVGICFTSAATPEADMQTPINRIIQNSDIHKNITYATVDTTNLKLDLYIPRNAEAPLPLVVWIHGGAWMAGSKDNPPAAPLLAHGFAVASISYRFTDVAIFPAQIYDCKAAIRFLHANAKQYNIDPNRIGVWGASAGGHLVALLGTTSGSDTLDGNEGEYTNTSDDVQAVCDWFGPSDMFTMPIGNRQFAQGQDPEIKLLGGSVSEKRELAALCSPVTHVSRNNPPFLIMHGDKDNLVPLQQSELLYEKLKNIEVDAKLIVMEGRGHGFSGPEAINPVIDFFTRILKQTEDKKMSITDIIPTSKGDLKITFIGHGTLMMQWAGRTIHIDPWTNLADYTKLPNADIILITHEHRDHLDINAIEQIHKDSTTVIAPTACAESIPKCTLMNNGDKQLLANDLTIEAVPSYNIVHKRPDGQPFHPEGRGNGYILTLGDTRVYIAGDTENTPEMVNLKNINIAFLPMNLPYTMTPEMATEAAISFKPKILYPYHYGDTDVNKLVQLLKDEKDIEVRIRPMQ